MLRRPIECTAFIKTYDLSLRSGRTKMKAVTATTHSKPTSVSHARPNRSSGCVSCVAEKDDVVVGVTAEHCEDPSVG